MEEQFEPPEMQQQSPLMWLFRALGFRYSVFLPFIALLAFTLAVIAIWRFKTPVLTALLLAVVGDADLAFDLRDTQAAENHEADEEGQEDDGRFGGLAHGGTR